MSIVELALGLKSLELGAELGDTNDAGDSGGEGRGEGNDVFVVALGVFDNEADGWGGAGGSGGKEGVRERDPDGLEFAFVNDVFLGGEDEPEVDGVGGGVVGGEEVGLAVGGGLLGGEPFLEGADSFGDLGSWLDEFEMSKEEGVEMD